MIIYRIFLVEIVYDFFDKLKLSIKGYVLFDYVLDGYMIFRLRKMDILLNGEVVDVLFVIVYYDFVYLCGKVIVEKLKILILR